MPFRILFADESPITRLGLSSLEWSKGNNIDRVVSSFNEIEKALQEEHFDVLITETHFNQQNVIEQLAELKDRMQDLRIILYTHNVNATIIVQAIAYHFYDVVFKTGGVRKIIDCVESIELGEPDEKKAIQRFKKFLSTHRAPMPAIMQVLTKREQHLSMLLSMGLNNKEISNVLGISLETVKEHVQNAIRKMKSKDRIALAVTVLKNKIPTVDVVLEDLV